MSDNLPQQKMDSANIRARSGKPRQGKAVSEELKIIPIEEKIEVEIRDIIRIRPMDFARIKDSFEEWAKQWD